MEAALLAEHFHILPEQLGRLTPRYIHKALYHYRDPKTGELKYRRNRKKEEITRKSQHEALDILRMLLGDSLQNYVEAKQKIDKKWDKKEVEKTTGEPSLNP